MAAVNLTELPDERHASTWSQMTARERVFAAWLKLRSGWNHIDLPTAALYDMETDRVLIEWEPGGTCWIAVVRWEVDATLANIEARYGVEARRAAEEVIANG